MAPCCSQMQRSSLLICDSLYINILLDQHLDNVSMAFISCVVKGSPLISAFGIDVGNLKKLF